MLKTSGVVSLASVVTSNESETPPTVTVADVVVEKFALDVTRTCSVELLVIVPLVAVKPPPLIAYSPPLMLIGAAALMPVMVTGAEVIWLLNATPVWSVNVNCVGVVSGAGGLLPPPPQADSKNIKDSKTTAFATRERIQNPPLRMESSRVAFIVLDQASGPKGIFCSLQHGEKTISKILSTGTGNKKITTKSSEVEIFMTSISVLDRK